MERTTKKIEITGFKAKCEKCGFEWVYTHGIPHYWMPCPKCKSKKNSLNIELFGKWHPNGDKKMKIGHLPDQSSKQTNLYGFIKYKYSYIYYAHPLALYGTEQERLDLEFLQNIKQVLNPKDINENKMSVFINYTLYAKEVWFRRYTAGVCLEVIIALLKHIPVYSLETRLPISTTEIKQIFTSYKNSGMFDHDFYILNDVFGKKFAQRFADIMDGEYP